MHFYTRRRKTWRLFNSLLKKSSTIPRHTEIDNFLAKKICRDLGVESPRIK